MKVITRLAPTPNGEIHWGNLMNFVLIWLKAKDTNARVILRFDDIDTFRCKEIYAEHTRDLLKYVGINYDLEISNQLSRKHEYYNFLENFPHYTCICSRQDILNRTGGFHYDGFCRKNGHAYSKDQNCVRFLSSREDLDFILWRKEDLPAYHLTSVMDDIDNNVNTVIRGEDLLESTLVQTEMLKYLGQNSIQFFHHRLITNSDGDKLSKTRSDGDLINYVKQNKLPAEMFTELASLMGLEATKYSSLNDFKSLKFEDFLV